MRQGGAAHDEVLLTVLRKEVASRKGDHALQEVRVASVEESIPRSTCKSSQKRELSGPCIRGWWCGPEPVFTRASLDSQDHAVGIVGLHPQGAVGLEQV